MPVARRRQPKPGTTFLQYVAERLLGPPARRTGTYGEAYWCCPFHNDTNPSFHTMPSKPQYKDRFRCFGCGAQGDEADLMDWRMPGENWPTRRRRLDQWRQEYEREAAQTQAAKVPPPAPAPATGGISFRGERGGGTPTRRPTQDHPLLVAAAWADLCEWERETLLAARAVMNGLRSSHPDVSFAALAQYSLDFRRWIRGMDDLHYLECDDPECEAAVCQWALPERRYRADMAHVEDCRDPECERVVCREMRRAGFPLVPRFRLGETRNGQQPATAIGRRHEAGDTAE